MELELIRDYCKRFKGTTEQVQWENHLLFKVGGKMYLIYNLSKEYPNRLSLKCSPERFEEMIEIENIVPAPYLARNKWISIKDGCRIRLNELKELISESYALVFQKLPKRVRDEITNCKKASKTKAVKKLKTK
jgi:predicted DNA-binding protein (MmcQ/YjbR family)